MNAPRHTSNSPAAAPARLSFATSVRGAPLAAPAPVAGARRGALAGPQAALSRPAKEATVTKLTEAFESASVVFGVRFQGVSVKSMESLRRALPPSAKLIVCKNTLVRRAAAAAGNWEALTPATSLENAWVFAPEDAIAGSVKAYLDFEKALHADLTKEEKEAKVKRTDVSGAVMEAAFLDSKALRSLKDMPTKLELITRIAVLIKKVPTKVALAINAVPTKVGRGVQALADGDDDKTKLVGDVFPKAA